MRVWLYCRLSNDDDREQNSLQNQRKITLEYARRKGFTVVGESFDDNASGMNFRREGVSQIIRAAEAGQINAVVVKALSRLGRHKTQTALFIDFLREREIKVISVTESIDTLNENDDLLVGVRGLMNDYYARDISKKIRAGYRQKQKEGLVITPPFGYWKNRNTRKVEIIEEAADTVRLIFSLYLDGCRLKEIARRLNEQGRKTPAQMQATLGGRPQPKGLWSYTIIKRVLLDESYTGTLWNHKSETNQGKKGDTIPKAEQFVHADFLPVIVSGADWNRAQRELERRSGKRISQGGNRPKHRYAGLLRCGDCGAAFVSMVRRWNGRERVEYICKTYLDHGKGRCPSHRIHEEVLDAEVKEAIVRMRDRLQNEADCRKQEIKDRALSKPLLDARRLSLEGEIKKLDEDIETLLMGRLRDRSHAEQYDSLMKRLTKEQETARQKLSDLKCRDTELRKEVKELERKVRDLDCVLQSEPVLEQDIRRLVERIVLKQAGRTAEISIKWKTAALDMLRAAVGAVKQAALKEGHNSE